MTPTTIRRASHQGPDGQEAGEVDEGDGKHAMGQSDHG